MITAHDSATGRAPPTARSFTVAERSQRRKIEARLILRGGVPCPGEGLQEHVFDEIAHGRAAAAMGQRHGGLRHPAGPARRPVKRNVHAAPFMPPY
jgi:hypothetical protein